MAVPIPTSVEQLLIASAVGRGPYKLAVKAGSSTNLTLSGEQTVDGVACVENDRVLAAGQTDPKRNGIWIVKVGPWVRATDHDTDRDMVLGARVEVMNGNTNNGDWRMTAPTTGAVVPDVTATTWAYATGQLQGANIDIGTEPSNATIDFGNGASSAIKLDGGSILLRAPAIELDTDNGSSLDITGTAGQFNFVSTDSVTLQAANLTLDALPFGGINLDVGTNQSLVIREDGVSVMVITPNSGGASGITMASDVTFTLGQASSGSGAGRTMTVAGQQGQAGQVGANVHIKSGLGGTGGTNLAGNILLGFGIPVGGATGRLIGQREDGTAIFTIYEIAAGTSALYFGGAGGTAAGVVRGSSVGIESATTTVSLQSAQDVFIGHQTGRDTFFREGANSVMTAHMDADGPTRLTLASGITSFSIDMPASTPLTFDSDTAVFRANTGAESNLTITPDVATLYTRIQALRGLRFTAQGSDGVSFECQHASGNVNLQAGSSGSSTTLVGATGLITRQWNGTGGLRKTEKHYGRVQTTDATANVVAWLSPVLPNGSTIFAEVRVVACTNGASPSAVYFFQAAFRTTGGVTTALTGSSASPTFALEDNASFNCQLGVDGANKIRILVTGVAATNIAWEAFPTLAYAGSYAP